MTVKQSCNLLLNNYYWRLRCAIHKDLFFWSTEALLAIISNN